MRTFALLLPLAACTGEQVDRSLLPPTQAPGPTVVPTVATLLGFVPYPSRPLVAAGQSAQLRARALWSDGTVSNRSADAVWVSSDVGVYTLDGTGLLSSSTAGIAGFEVTLEGYLVLGQAVVYGPGVQLTSVEVLPSEATISATTELLFAAVGQLSDGVTGEVGSQCAWSSSDTSVVLVGAAGAVSAIAPGVATLTASCDSGTSGSALITVEDEQAIQPPPDLHILSFDTLPLGGDRFRFEAVVENQGGYAGPLSVDFYDDRADLPDGTGNLRMMVPGLGTSTTFPIALERSYDGARPTSLASWAWVDADGRSSDVNPDDNLTGPVTTILPGDLTADLEAVLASTIVFGPTQAGIVIEVTNHGPEIATDVTVYFESDEPGAGTISDLDVASAERSETVATLGVGETYTWVFEFDQIPYPDPWWTCAFVPAAGILDPDLSNNLSCSSFSEF